MRTLSKPYYAVYYGSVLTNVNYEPYSGKQTYVKGIFDDIEEARERCAYMNESGRGGYEVRKVEIKLMK